MMQIPINNNPEYEVSHLGFGAMRLPTKNGRIDKIRANELLNYAIDNGINYIDTAYIYHNGECESFLKDILNKRRSDIYISTKLPVMFVKSKEDLRDFLEKQPQKLGVECIDFYYLHSLNLDQFNKLKEYGIFEFLDEIKAEGKVKNVGFSFHDNFNSFKTIADSYKWDMCLLQYNFIDIDTQAGIRGIRYAYEKGINVFVMEPLKGGLLSDNVPGKVASVMDDENITDSPARWALKWLFNQKEITCILSGMNTIDQITDNIKTATDTQINSISDTELEVYDKIKSIYDDLIKIPCTSCRYCMACPHGVDIPECFKCYNDKMIFNRGSGTYMVQLSGLSGGSGSYASKCVECGVCISKCPQHIDIPNELKTVTKEMEMPGFKYLMKFVEVIGKPVYKFLTTHS